MFMRRKESREKEKENRLISMKDYSHRFLLHIALENMDQLCLEFELKFKKFEEIPKNLLSEKSKRFLALWNQMTYMNRDKIRSQLDALAKELWGDLNESKEEEKEN